jgi:hypothetical protein
MLVEYFPHAYYLLHVHTKILSNKDFGSYNPHCKDSELVFLQFATVK